MRTLIRAMSWLVPRASRQAWLETWARRIDARQLLQARGQPVGPPRPSLRRRLRDAAGERTGPIHIRSLLRSPSFVPIATAGALLLLAGVSHGFAKTRWVLAVVHDIRAHPAFCGVYDPRGDRLFAHLAPSVLAWAVGL